MTPTTTSNEWDELIRQLNSSHICNVKKVVVQGMEGARVDGLEIYANPLLIEGRLEIIKEVIGDDYSVTHYPNDQTFYIEKMIK